MIIRHVVVAVFAVVLEVAGASGAAAADSHTQAERRPAFSLTVSPARFVISPRAHEMVHKITAYNTGRSGLDVHVVLTGFQQLPNGEVVFGRPGAESDADWIKVRPATFHLQPGEERKVRLDVDPPADAEPGDHEVGVVFLVPSQTSEANLTVNRGVGAQLLIRAPGPVVRDISLTDLDVPRLSTGGDVPVDLTVTNAGTVHQDFFAPNNRIIGSAGGDRLPFPDLSVLAGVTRTVEATWSDPPWICHCEITVSLPNGHGGMSTMQTDVWIVPIYHILGALLLIAGSLLLIQWRRHRLDAALAAAREQGYEEATKQAQPVHHAASRTGNGWEVSS